MKTIKGFEGEEIVVSGFGEWVGKDYIDYKFEYKNKQKVIKELFKENQELKKQLEERPKEYVFIGNAQNKTRDFIHQITKENRESKKQQKEFIEWLEGKLSNELGIFTEIRVCDVLSKYKEIIGGKDE